MDTCDLQRTRDKRGMKSPTRYVEIRRRFLREHPGHALDCWPLPAD
jgi:hypothetical protein